MKSIIDHINEAMVRIEESRSVFADINLDWDDDDMEVYAPEAINDCYQLVGKFESVKMNDLKKIKDWKDYDNAKLEDYVDLFSGIGAWMNGVLSQAEDELSEARMYIEMIQYLGEDHDNCIENVADNVGNLKSVEDGEDVYDYLDDIFNHWDEVSKVLFRKSWN